MFCCGGLVTVDHGDQMTNITYTVKSLYILHIYNSANSYGGLLNTKLFAVTDFLTVVLFLYNTHFTLLILMNDNPRMTAPC